MLADLPIRFEHPWLLLILLLVIPVLLLARLGAAGQGRGKLIFSVVVRSLLVMIPL